MAVTTTELITRAYYASGIVAREFETVSGSQITDGLYFLNDLLGESTVDEGMIPYETTYTFNASPTVEKYFIPDLIKINTIVFYLNNVRFAMKYEKRNQYFGATRIENINTLPYKWFFERQFGGGDLYIYFQPDQAYPFEVHGIFRLSSVALGDDLSLTFDQFYLTYLRYALAHRLCAENNEMTPIGVQKQLSKYEDLIDKKSRLLDLSATKSSTLQKRGGLNWAMANLYRGFLPP